MRWHEMFHTCKEAKLSKLGADLAGANAQPPRGLHRGREAQQAGCEERSTDETAANDVAVRDGQVRQAV